MLRAPPAPPLAIFNICTGSGARIFVLIAASYDVDSPPEPYVSGSAAHSRKEGLPRLHTRRRSRFRRLANGATEGVRIASKAASANQAVPAAAATSIGEVSAHTTTVGDAATAADDINVCQATPVVIGDIATAAATDGFPPLPTDVRPSIRMPHWTPKPVLVLESSSQSATRSVQLSLPMPSPERLAGALGRRVWDPRRLQNHRRRHRRHQGQRRRHSPGVGSPETKPRNIAAFATRPWRPR